MLDKGAHPFKDKSLSRAVPWLRSPSHHPCCHDNPHSGQAMGSECQLPQAQALLLATKGVTSPGFKGLICDRKRKPPPVLWSHFWVLKFITCRFGDSVLCLCLKSREERGYIIGHSPPGPSWLSLKVPELPFHLFWVQWRPESYSWLQWKKLEATALTGKLGMCLLF